MQEDTQQNGERFPLPDGSHLVVLDANLHEPKSREELLAEIDRLERIVKQQAATAGTTTMAFDLWLKPDGGVTGVLTAPSVPDDRFVALTRPLMVGVGRGLAAELQLRAIINQALAEAGVQG